MKRIESVASYLIDAAMSEHALPRPCPCDFGPEGRYRLEEVIGCGRDSFVYRATDRRLSSEGHPAKVAIKIHESGASTLPEAVSARRVHHPAVVQVLDSGIDEDGTSYLVTELLAGGDLSAFEPPLPPRQAASIIRQLADGVQALHSAGVVHGDLKPANVLLTGEQAPKIADFDLASRDDETRRGGNFAFISPEVVRDAATPPAPPADIYALGGLLHLLLTGELPNGSTPDAVRARLAEPAEPAPGAAPRDLDRIRRRALAYRPEDRYRSAGELASDLENWLNARPLAWTKPSSTRRAILWSRRNPVGAAAMILLILLGGFASAWYARRMDHRAELARIEFDKEKEAVALAQQKADAANAKLRAYIEAIAESGLLANRARSRSYIMPSMVWLGWLTDTPVLNDAGSTLRWNIRVDHLETFLAQPRELGQLDHLDARLAQFILATLYIKAGRWGDAEPLHSALAGWRSELAPDDPVRPAIDAIGLGLETARAVTDGRLSHASATDRLNKRIAELGAEGDREDAIRVLEHARSALARSAPVAD